MYTCISDIHCIAGDFHWVQIFVTFGGGPNPTKLKPNGKNKQVNFMVTSLSN